MCRDPALDSNHRFHPSRSRSRQSSADEAIGVIVRNAPSRLFAHSLRRVPGPSSTGTAAAAGRASDPSWPCDHAVERTLHARRLAAAEVALHPLRAPELATPGHVEPFRRTRNGSSSSAPWPSVSSLPAHHRRQRSRSGHSAAPRSSGAFFNAACPQTAATARYPAPARVLTDRPGRLPGAARVRARRGASAAGSSATGPQQEPRGAAGLARRRSASRRPLLLRRQHRRHVAPFQARRRFDDRVRPELIEHPIEERPANLRVQVLAAPEQDGQLDLVPSCKNSFALRVFVSRS